MFAYVVVLGSLLWLLPHLRQLSTTGPRTGTMGMTGTGAEAARGTAGRGPMPTVAGPDRPVPVDDLLPGQRGWVRPGKLLVDADGTLWICAAATAHPTAGAGRLPLVRDHDGVRVDGVNRMSTWSRTSRCRRTVATSRVTTSSYLETSATSRIERVSALVWFTARSSAMRRSCFFVRS
ncbi:hypothetical protein DVS28_a2896 [Euzebya pacifica]|uniref:Uncharacterized protein n=1 Tax=Euzebya pacifica TaxID=1608957 RepID=A0A346XZC8_9ACTN|nr:hypothetical protein [Euzebya pacifica]AXV07575.1 hypothetical protein DVS28_a2896 [Euzebya pacifica]